MRRRSTDIESGMTSTSLYPFTAATMARPMPVLPEVGSMMTLSFPSTPRRSASSIMERPIRSLMLPPGLARSSFIQTSRLGKRRLRRTWGVLPMVSRMLLARMTVLDAV